MKKLALGLWLALSSAAQAQYPNNAITQQLALSITCNAATPVTFIAGVSGTIINIMKLTITNSAGTILNFQDSNGSPVTFTGNIALPVNTNLIWFYDGSPWISTTVAGRGLNIVCSGVGVTSGLVQYQQPVIP